MTQEIECPDGYASDAEIPQLPIAIKKLGLASHHYGTKEKRKDFKNDFLNILKEFDSHKCDSVLFSSYTLKTNALEKLNLPDVVQDLTHIRAIFFEELQGNSCMRYHVWLKNGARWVQHICHQAFGTLKTDEGKAEQFVAGFAKKRASGNFALMLCGETNIVRQRKDMASGGYKIVDESNFWGTLLPRNKIILNPIHDVMSPRYMNPKRKFLSQGNRVVVSVWNEGKLSKQTTKAPSRSLDVSVPWSLFEDGQETADRIQALALPSGTSSDVRLAVLEI